MIYIEEGGIINQNIEYCLMHENVESFDVDFELRAFLIRELTLCKENFMTLSGFTIKDSHNMVSNISNYWHCNSNTFINL